MAMNQPRQYGAADPAVAGRLIGLLQELTWCDRAGHYRTEILDHLGRMRDAVGAANYSLAERRSLLEQADATELLLEKPDPGTGRTHRLPG